MTFQACQTVTLTRYSTGCVMARRVHFLFPGQGNLLCHAQKVLPDTQMRAKKSPGHMYRMRAWHTLIGPPAALAAFWSNTRPSTSSESSTVPPILGSTLMSRKSSLQSDIHSCMHAYAMGKVNERQCSLVPNRVRHIFASSGHASICMCAYVCARTRMSVRVRKGTSNASLGTCQSTRVYMAPYGCTMHRTWGCRCPPVEHYPTLVGNPAPTTMLVTTLCQVLTCLAAMGP